MKHCVLFLSLLALPGSAGAQNATAKSESTPDVKNEVVTFAELEGLVVEGKAVRQQVVRRDGKQFPTTAHQDWKINIGPGNKIELRTEFTTHTPNGVFKGKPTVTSATLEQPQQAKNLGGGHGVWIFAEGKLTGLRTYQGGAYKKEITFTRSGQRLTCESKENYAREDGSGKIISESAVDGVPLEIVSFRPISSTCQVKLSAKVRDR